MTHNNQALNHDVAIGYLKKFAFGGLVTEDFQITYLPFVMVNEHTLEFHLAKSNPQLSVLDNAHVLLTVLGPHAYISSYAYASKPQVPTWNYLSINVKGHCHVLPDDETPTSIENMLRYFEQTSLADKITTPDAFKDKLYPHIQCVRMDISSIVGKAKLGQHKSITDQQAVLAHLASQGKQVFVDFVKEHLKLVDE